MCVFLSFEIGFRASLEAVSGNCCGAGVTRHKYKHIGANR